MFTYEVYQLINEGYKVLATIEGEVVTGSGAKWIEKTLREYGWPGVDPRIVFHGMYVWAVKVDSRAQSA
jgi:hypothetical protein